MLPVPDVALADRRVVLRAWCVDPPCRVSAVGSRESRHSGLTRAGMGAAGIRRDGRGRCWERMPVYLYLCLEFTKSTSQTI